MTIPSVALTTFSLDGIGVTFELTSHSGFSPFFLVILYWLHTDSVPRSAILSLAPFALLLPGLEVSCLKPQDLLKALDFSPVYCGPPSQIKV